MGRAYTEGRNGSTAAGGGIVDVDVLALELVEAGDDGHARTANAAVEADDVRELEDVLAEHVQLEVGPVFLRSSSSLESTAPSSGASLVSAAQPAVAAIVNRDPDASYLRGALCVILGATWVL